MSGVSEINQHLTVNLRSECGCETRARQGAFPRYDAVCADAVHVDPITGRFFITMGHPGFNAPANNAKGYKSLAMARATIARYLAVA